jgi:hypothetical protein
MADENTNIPLENTGDGAGAIDSAPPETAVPPPAEELTQSDHEDVSAMDNVPMEERLERLGGEPAPVITPEEFARLQKAGQVHIDARGRVRTARRSGVEAGVSLRKRRAWYGR